MIVTCLLLCLFFLVFEQSLYVSLSCFLPDSKPSNASNINLTYAKSAFIISSRSMNSPSTRFVPSRRMDIYEPIHQIGMWGENFKSNGNPNTSASVIVEVDNKIENKVQLLEILFFAWLLKNIYLISERSNLCYLNFPVWDCFTWNARTF